ncbi:MAG: phenylalanine--tRNA ligase subunit beta [Pelagibacterales bacterium]|nr:phenylalanine--tRNA ligase subunit beta [Pelagibacterales bacterium]
MKITSSWLKDHLKTNANIEKIVSTLNNIGLEVESVGSADKNNFFFVAKIIKAEKHPNADKLKLCDVDIGFGKIVKVVCGASNARDGLLTVYAGPGAIIPKNQLKIKVTNIRGIDSYGMLCSESELGLSDESQGITELDLKKFKVGSSYFKNNSEPAIDISITPNRSDCQGVRGIARDLSTAGLGKLIDLEQIKLKTNIKNPFKVILQSNSGCSSFAHCYIEGIKNSESPKWLKDKLIAVGMNPISAVVDITNYIMLDLNRPLHAYDADKIEKKVIVRASRKGEKFSALDNNTYSLEDGACLITNEKEILGLGGVIGGENSSISLDTKNIFLESALFDPVKISKIAKKLGINSDAKFRFERGVDPNGMEYGLKLAAKIIHKICGGKISNLTISGENNFKNKQIKFNSDKFEKIIGSKISPAEIKKILNNLGFKLKESKNIYSVIIPTWRPDIKEEVDIVEELIRIRGYDKIQLIKPEMDSSKDVLTGKQKLHRFAQRSIANKGFMETITYSFTNSKIDSLFGIHNKSLLITNPISNDLDTLRSSIFSNLLIHIKNNIHRNFEDQKIFESGPVFFGSKPGEQIAVIGGIQIGKIYRKNWLEKDKEVDVFEIKDCIYKTLIELGIHEQDLTVIQESETYYHPGRSGKFYLNFNKQLPIANFGEINPKIIKELDIKNGPIFGFQIFLNNIPVINKQNTKKKIKYSVSNFQKIERDFAFIVDKKFEAEKIVNSLLNVDKKLIKKIRIFDVFQGGNIEKNKRSIALNLLIQSPDKTLKDKEIDELSDKIIQTMQKSFDATLRS